MTLKNIITPKKRRKKLKKLLEQKPLIRVIEVHNGLSALVANDAKVELEDGTLEFDALWGSGFTDSASKGYPDADIVSFDSRIKTITEILNVTNKPLIVDGDTGGDPNNFEYLVSKLERLGVSAIIIEDKTFPKRNSLKTGKQILEDPDVFAKKIKRGKEVLLTKDFMIIARIESFISGYGIEDALLRAKKYLTVGVDGIHPTLFPRRMLSKPFIDFVILREGEFRIVALMEALEEEKNPDREGICYKDGEKIIINPATTIIENLDEIPFPARHLVDFERYIKIYVPFAPFSKKERVAQLLTTRGCPFHCNFCSTQAYWGRFRARSVDNVMEEIEELVTRYKIEEIQFADDNMTIDKKRAKELFRRMKEYDLSWCTPHGLAIITLDEEMIRLMAESGAYQISVGVESGCQEVLDNIIHKRLNLDMVKPIVDIAHKYGISVHGLFIVGFPRETKEQIMQTLNFPKKIGFESVSFFIANPMPGSDLWKECKEKGYLSDEYKNLNFETMDFKAVNIIIPKDSEDYVFNPEELVKLVDKKTMEYNEWSKKKWPDKWNVKFKTFLERHPDTEIIMGRVT